MIGMWSAHSAEFLNGLGVAAFAALGAPMLLRPLTWARWLRWHVPPAGPDQHLAIYFGRCLGAVVCVLAVFALVAAQAPALQPFYFALTILACALMVAVHAWGAWRAIQPRTETVETLAWAVLLILALLCYPGWSTPAGH